MAVLERLGASWTPAATVVVGSTGEPLDDEPLEGVRGAEALR